jgi:hypothetical protein
VADGTARGRSATLYRIGNPSLIATREDEMRKIKSR